MMNRSLVLLLVMMCLTSTVQAQEVSIGTVREAWDRMDILVQPLDVVSGGTEAQEAAWVLESVIGVDLDYSGLFKALSPAEGDTTTVTFAIEGVLEGRLPGTAVTDAEAAPVLNLRLMSYPGRQVLLNKRYRPTWDKLRASAHHFVDEVVLFLHGEPGICLTRIVFARGSDDRRDIHCVDFDGEGELRLTANRQLNLFPTWSPDNNQLAFMSWREGQQGIYLLETATGEVRAVNETPGSNLNPAWHPSGEELLVSLSKVGQHEIYRLGLQGNIIRRLTVNPAIEISPSWSPNGRDIIFTSDQTGAPQIYIMAADGSNKRRLTFEGRYNDAAAWSPNGEKIVYATRIGDFTQIVLINPDGTNRFELTGPEWRNCEDPSWAPDSRHIVFASDRSGVFKLYVLDILEGGIRQLTFGDEPDKTPDWSH